MLDGELGGEVIDLDQLEPVSITNVELRLDGADLLDDPELRRGLVDLWRAEAESAGLDVDTWSGLGTGQPATPATAGRSPPSPAAASSTSCGPLRSPPTPAWCCIRAEPLGL